MNTLIPYLIFICILVILGYFAFEWHSTIKVVNLNTEKIIANIREEQNIRNKGTLGSPCSIIIGENINPTENGNPYVCGEGLICVTGIYQAEGPNTGTGVCLSSVGNYCDTISDCEPSVQSCVGNTCENLGERINLPCKYDSDCIGDFTPSTSSTSNTENLENRSLGYF